MEQKNTVNRYFACANTIKPAVAMSSHCCDKSANKYEQEYMAFNQEQINWLNSYSRN